jgi:hypothetical protein
MTDHDAAVLVRPAESNTDVARSSVRSCHATCEDAASPLVERPQATGGITAGIAPLRTTEHAGKRQEETFTDLITAAAGIILGQRGRGAPVAILRGISYPAGDEGVAAMLHHRP